MRQCTIVLLARDVAAVLKYFTDVSFWLPVGSVHLNPDRGPPVLRSDLIYPLPSIL